VLLLHVGSDGLLFAWLHLLGEAFAAFQGAPAWHTGAIYDCAALGETCQHGIGLLIRLTTCV
jgi:hypothetical protein